MQKYIIRVLFLLMTLGLGAFPVWAQAEGSSADLTGLVFDSAKSGIGGAVITTVNLDTMLSRTTTTDSNGAYRLPLLQPGDYEIKVKAEGFNSQVKRGITLTVGQTVAVNFELTLGIKTQVEVIAVETPLIETERTHQAATITQRPINNLPINGRNFLDFAKLTPGVVEESPEVTKILIPQLQTSGLSFAGQNGRSNNIQIDGVDQN
ncbi:MAG TPA: carboxypeptidase-like regulatory domain-containing protein, partial [Blastocatellia bacterium]|nr:carboxypeptidase-like regulatory domain-containing protein [Blastocatellia bacterium]